jgi:formate dehydrogenase major subunit
MTNHWLDLQNAKVFLIEGSNAAENHVMSVKWMRKAQQKGAIVIHVDPRFNRTSSTADIYARIRPGTDIAFVNAMIHYVLEHELYDKEYVKLHTNALYLVQDEFQFADGLFSGFGDETLKYDTASWGYELDAKGHPKLAKDMDDPHCVFAHLQSFYCRYTLEAASSITGIPAATIQKIAETFAAHRPGTIMYALGITQHTVGVQNIRSFAVLQSLLGNIGKPGGGVNALRGEPNVQGASDVALLYNYLPGYLSYPSHTEPTLHDYAHKYGTFRAKFVVNMLKAWFGANATPENDFGYPWLPKKNAAKTYTIFHTLEAALEGKMKMLYVVGQNPMVTMPNLNLVHDALAQLDMLVVQDLWDTETASFWLKPDADPKAIKTEVVVLPAAYFMEKEGSITGSGRLVQWRYKAVNPPGEAKSDLKIFDQLYRRLRFVYRNSTAEKDQVLAKGTWDYEGSGTFEGIVAESVLKEMSGRNLKTGELVSRIPDLAVDGSTSSGCWIYAGVFAGGKNLSKRRDNKTDPGGLGIYPQFGWTWPGNTHILYNCASCDADGKPFQPDKAIVWWDKAQKKWTGYDTPDVSVATDGPETANGQKPFRMNAEGVGRLMATAYVDPDPTAKDLPRDASTVLVDGPFPEFYEPVESPTANLLHPKVQNNPCLKYPRVKGRQPVGKAEDFPFVLMTSTMTEHFCSGAVTRNVPWLNELVPEPMVEMPEKLAKDLDIKNGDWVTVSSARGEVTVKAVITPRMQTLNINGREVAIVWMPFNWGFKGLSHGPSANLVTIDAADPGAWCQESKACLVNLTASRSKEIEQYSSVPRPEDERRLA